jgi:hypothetical protein
MALGDRCQAVHPLTGVQCGYPAGHSYRHGNGTMALSWSDEDAAAEVVVEVEKPPGYIWGDGSG